MSDAPAYEYVRPINRKKVSSRFEVGPMERIRNAVYALLDRGFPATVEREVSIAIEKRAAEIEQFYNAGEPFPEREYELMPGRKVDVHRGRSRKSLPPDQR